MNGICPRFSFPVRMLNGPGVITEIERIPAQPGLPHGAWLAWKSMNTQPPFRTPRHRSGMAARMVAALVTGALLTGALLVAITIGGSAPAVSPVDPASLTSVLGPNDRAMP